MPDQEPISSLEKYRAAVQLIGISEASTWGRLSGFLTVASLLLVGWGLTKDVDNAHQILAGAGLALSIGMFLLILRSRAFVRIYAKFGKDLERGDGPLTEGEKLKGLGSRHIAPTIVVIFMLAFLAALVFTLEAKV